MDVNGEILFDPGRRETDPQTGQDRYVGGDIDERYAFYVGRASDPGNATVNNLIADILDTLGTRNDIWGVRDGELPRLAGVILDHARAVFQPVEEESVLDKFFAKYGADTDRTIQTLRRVTSLSQPFLHLQENAPNYAHNINKEQTIVGVLHGAAPRTESEQRFQTMIMETVAGIKDQQISNSNEAHQVLFLRERAAFPLRLLQGMEAYQYAYDQVKALGAAANPIHTRTGREGLGAHLPAVGGGPERGVADVRGRLGVRRHRRGTRGALHQHRHPRHRALHGPLHRQVRDAQERRPRRLQRRRVAHRRLQARSRQPRPPAPGGPRHRAAPLRRPPDAGPDRGGH